jgi:glutathione S-transferase
MKLYYAPGACSLADHIALQEADMKFDLVKVDLRTHKLEDGRSFKEINPKGYVPALELDDGEILTENVAILSHIADQYPALAVPGKHGRDRLLEMLAYLSSELHKAFHPLFDPNATEVEKKQAADKVGEKLAFITTRLQGPYLFGENATVADAYLFVMLMWAAKNDIAFSGALKTFHDRMLSRPTVHAALMHERLIQGK